MSRSSVAVFSPLLYTLSFFSGRVFLLPSSCPPCYSGVSELTPSPRRQGMRIVECGNCRTPQHDT